MALPKEALTGFTAALVYLVLGSLCPVAEASAASSVLGFVREAYTTNAICAKKNCINPVFPGMEDLHRLQQAPWVCSSMSRTTEHMGFCRGAISYDPALPVPVLGENTVKAMVQRQENAASTMFYFHLNGMGLEAWDYQQPQFADDCVKSIWRMACFTYFPRAQIGCQDGAMSEYIRPCQSSCMNYVRQCGVECCDESVQCVFTHTKAIAGGTPGQTVTTEGYIPHDGPSSLCTGGARRSAKPLGAVFWVVVMLVMALSLQGCTMDIPEHHVGNWRGQPDYLIQHDYNTPATGSLLNSCSLEKLSQSLQCSGRGVCKLWDPENIKSTLTFCKCDRDFADPECRTRRQSQTAAYLLSLFVGATGADAFYLGHTNEGFFKLFSTFMFSVAAFGKWVVDDDDSLESDSWTWNWMLLRGFGAVTLGKCFMDIIAIGSAPVYAERYRVSADLPHFVFVLTATAFAVFWGFVIAYVVTIFYRFDRQKEAYLMQLNDEAIQWDAIKDYKQPKGFAPPTRDLQRYGTLPPTMDTMGMMRPNMGSMPPTSGAMGPPMTGPATSGIGMMNPFGRV